jgi:hypothetical protein
MIETSYFREKEKIEFLPKEVQGIIQGILQVLDTEYGAGRDIYEDDGGYVIIVEKKGDFAELEEKTDIDCDTITCEYVDKIKCDCGEVYTNSLILLNNEYGITLLIPLEITPENILNQMIE